MKNNRILMLSMVMALVASSAFGAEKLLLSEGKEAKINVRVVDADGKPVPNAKVCAEFSFIDIGEIKEKEYTTDSNGCATVCGNCVDGVTYTVSGPGWYDGMGGRDFLESDEPLPDPPFKDGKWLPYGIEQKIVLKKVIEPVPMIAGKLLDFRTPEANKDYGWDLECSALVEPYGTGKVADFYVKHTWVVDTEKGITKEFIITFPNEKDGYYVVTCTPDSKLMIPNKANPDEKYEKEYRQKMELCCDPKQNVGKPLERPFKFHNYEFKDPLKEGDKEEFPESKVFIMRTRTKLDKDGKMTGAHYSVMFGPLKFGFSETSISLCARTFFNPYEGNTSLEYSKKKTREYYSKLRKAAQHEDDDDEDDEDDEDDDDEEDDEDDEDDDDDEEEEDGY